MFLFILPNGTSGERSTRAGDGRDQGPGRLHAEPNGAGLKARASSRAVLPLPGRPDAQLLHAAVEASPSRAANV
jgi:hypothetical protein